MWQVLWAATLMSAVVACDMLESDPDVLAPETDFTDDEIYVLANETSFIDLNTSLKTNVPAQIEITSETRYGKLTDLGSGILQYEPTIGNATARDNFEFTVSTLNHEVIKRDTVVIVIENDSTQLPCNLYPRPDYVYGVKDSTIVIDVTNNDIICNTTVTVSVFKPSNNFPPYFGQAEVVGNKIKYTPGPSFDGTDKIMYKITAVGNPSRVAFGMVYISGDSSCSFGLVDDQYTFSQSAVDSLAILRVFQNDSLCKSIDQYQINLKSGPTYGQVARVANGFSYKVPSVVTYPFQDHFIYEVCVDALCKTANVTVRLMKDSVATCSIYARPDSIDISTLSVNIVRLQVLLNDSICGNLEKFKIIKSPAYGSAVVSNREILYEATDRTQAYDSLQYEICNGIGCSRAGVIIKRHD